MKELKQTENIKKWLLSYTSYKWFQDSENPNCFSNNHLEALHVHEQTIKYWEDIRAGKASFNELPIPINKEQLYSIID